MKSNLSTQVEVNKSLLKQQQVLRTKYDDSIKVNQDVQERQKDLIQEIEQFHAAILQICPNKQLTPIDSIGKPIPAVKAVSSPAPVLSSTPPPQMITSRTMAVPTAAALKMGVGFPLQHLRKDDTGRILSTQCASNNDELLNECGICKKCSEQHLLAKCDTCHLYYHLGCLNPPLSRHPKRSKLYAWQCSECDKSDDSAPENVIIPKGPRRSRIRYSKDGSIIDSFESEQSVSMTKKGDETQSRHLNGSEIQPKVEAISVPETPAVVNDIFGKMSELTTSTPVNSLHVETLVPKKRGRKPKAKASFDASGPIESAESIATSKDTSTESNHVAVKKQKLSEPKAGESLLIKTSEVPISKVPKKGRPKKEKPSIAEISKNLQKKHASGNLKGIRSVASVLNFSKIKFPIEQRHQTILDIPNSIPYPAPNPELPKMPDTLIPMLPIKKLEPEPDDAIIICRERDPVVNGAAMNGDGTSSSGHKHKKQKKNKRRHSHSPSSGDRAPSGKKHKKRKRKDHDLDEKASQSLQDIHLLEQPGIKLKFRKMVHAGDDKKVIQWSLPTASGVESYRNNLNDCLTSNPIERQVDISVENHLFNHDSPVKEPMISPTNGHGSTASPKKRKKPLSSQKKGSLLLNIKGISSPVIAPSHFSPTISAVVVPPVPLAVKNCDVCLTPGSTQNLVK